MTERELGRMTSLSVGIVVGLILVVILMRYINSNRRMKTEYDEMQQILRNKGYKYGFYAMVIYEALVSVVSIGMDIPAVPLVVHFMAIFIGILVQASYCIWHDAYVGLNTNLKRYFVVAIIASVINFLSAFMAWRSGTLVTDHVLQAPFVNLLCGVLFAVLGVVGLLKKTKDKEVEE